MIIKLAILNASERRIYCGICWQDTRKRMRKNMLPLKVGMIHLGVLFCKNNLRTRPLVTNWRPSRSAFWKWRRVAICFIRRVIPLHTWHRQHGIKGFVVSTESFGKIRITKIFCYHNKMFSSINKTFGCCSKSFGCGNKKKYLLSLILLP